MKWPILVLVVVGVLAALGAAALTAALRAGQGTAAQPPQPTVQVVVAAKPLKGMTVLGSDCVALKTVPVSPETPKFLGSAADVLGKVLVVPMVEGQAFTKACFPPEGSGLTLASMLSNGKRAMSISLSNYAALEGLLYPGSIVDVLVCQASPKGDADLSASTTLLSGIQVLAIEDRTLLATDKEEKKADSTATAKASTTSGRVTLMVTSQQAEALQAAMEHGTLSLTMRNPLDKDIALQKPVGPSFWDMGRRLLASLPARRPPAAPVVEKAPPAQPPPQWEVSVLRGSTSETQSFPLPAKNLQAASR